MSRRIDPAALRLIAITDGMDDGVDSLLLRVVAAVAGGATSVQIRLKAEPARTIAMVTRRVISAVTVPVLVNDRFDIALASGAHGVHLGAEDIPVSVVRKLVPATFVIGTSVGCDAELSNAADADYVGIGPLFATSSKADAGDALGAAEFARLRGALITIGSSSSSRIPTVAIGGITAVNARAAIAAGADGIAVISALFRSPDPRLAAMALIRATGS